MVKRDTQFANWRLSTGIVTKTEYLKKFAYLPTKLSDNKIVWVTHYYKKQYQYYYMDNTVPFKIEDDILISEHQMMYILLSGDN